MNAGKNDDIDEIGMDGCRKEIKQGVVFTLHLPLVGSYTQARPMQRVEPR